MRILFGVANQCLGIFTQNAKGQRIGEYAAVLQHLMDGAVNRSGAGCTAGLSRLHLVLSAFIGVHRRPITFFSDEDEHR
jgi:hypothetical protein